MLPAFVRRGAVVAVATLGLLAPSLASATSTGDVAPAPASPTAQSTSSDPVYVLSKLVRKVNKGKRAQARNWAKRRVVRSLFDARAKGYRFRPPTEDCVYNYEDFVYDCSATHRRDGQVTGSAYFAVDGPPEKLKAYSVFIAYGE